MFFFNNKISLDSYFPCIMFLFVLFQNLDLEISSPLFSFLFRKSCRFGCCCTYDSSPMNIERCIMCILWFTNVYFECIWMTILHVYSNIIISINGLDIMVTLGIYFKYIKNLCKIFNKYIVPILQVYPNYLIVHLKIIIDDIYYIILYYIFLLITYN